MIPSVLESLAFWTGIAAVGCTAVAALFGCLARSFSSRASTLKIEGMGTALAETIAGLERSADWTGRATVIFTAVAAGFGCLVFLFSSNVAEMKDEARSRFEIESLTKIKTAEDGTAKALAEAATAKENTSRLEVEAANLRERAARAEKELIEVQGQIQPRRLTLEQQTRFLRALERVPKGSILVDTVLGDGEALMFARQIRDILKAAGWGDVPLSRTIHTGNSTGVSILYWDKPSIAIPLADAFVSAGIRTESSRDPQTPEGAVQILVGMKPYP